jgi:hypothetical protein
MAARASLIPPRFYPFDLSALYCKLYSLLFCLLTILFTCLGSWRLLTVGQRVVLLPPPKRREVRCACLQCGIQLIV